MNVTLPRLFPWLLALLVAMISPLAAVGQAATAPVTRVDELALTLVDGNGYTVIDASRAFQFQDGVVQQEDLPLAVIESLEPFELIDNFAATYTLQHPDEYYPTGVFLRVTTFEDAPAAAYYVENVLEAVVRPEQEAGTFAGNSVAMDALPDHDGAIAGWTFDTYTTDGGVLPSVRYVAQVGSLAVSVTVVSQNPDTAASAALDLTEAQVAAVRADQPAAPIPFPVTG